MSSVTKMSKEVTVCWIACVFFDHPDELSSLFCPDITEETFQHLKWFTKQIIEDSYSLLLVDNSMSMEDLQKLLSTQQRVVFQLMGPSNDLKCWVS